MSIRPMLMDGHDLQAAMFVARQVTRAPADRAFLSMPLCCRKRPSACVDVGFRQGSAIGSSAHFGIPDCWLLHAGW